MRVKKNWENLEGQISVANIFAVPSRILQKIFGITRSGLSRWIDSGCPRLESGSYDLPAVIKWREKKLKGAIDEEDPKIKYVRIMGQLKELDLAQKEGRLVSVPAIHAVHVRMAQLLRGVGERLGLKYGADAQVMLNDTLIEFERELEGFIEAQESSIAGGDLADAEQSFEGVADDVKVRMR
ncbi:MAG: hypothetical protein BWY90_00048 [Deltaproteobacteria bacterium ADurb.BinA014]|nr:MAG: hypothetical protein BWY90_00048 [Deltaproteobacteria bacterium ADurb.BinA014]HOR65943.1 hypothetical protein [Candidatus Sumerlaeota bacterium]